ncbi:hypothetical protein [Noviherbaspirillum galbum]|uniref:Uncharacterized protein n=1 Tax=Noviherbaspirillum galbum TaxID=2709383 RepID=A0A6B3SNU1_9BURK|nr:hypothetical protein [Noviherbaspirillum galbum]NEX62464.1 hypothetical protein [Noviherbaspirillum galbum]
MRYLDLTGLDRCAVFASVFSVMFHPEDPYRRNALKAWLEVNVNFCQGTLEEISPETLRFLIEAGDRGAGSDLRKKDPGRPAAGHALIALLTMKAAHIKDAGLDKAFYLVSEIYRGEKDYDGKPLRVRRESMRKHWRSYSSVAHLWAAYLVLLAEAKEGGYLKDVWRWLDCERLVAVAKTIQDQAEQCSLPRRQGPLRRDSAIRIVGIAGEPWRPDELSLNQRQLLSEFTSRSNQ